MTVADLLVEVLADAGTRRVYGVSGDSLNGITDSIRAPCDAASGRQGGPEPFDAIGTGFSRAGGSKVGKDSSGNAVEYPDIRFQCWECKHRSTRWGIVCTGERLHPR